MRPGSCRDRQSQITRERVVGALGQMIVTPLLLVRLLLLLLFAATGQDIVGEAELDLARIDAVELGRYVDLLVGLADLDLWGHDNLQDRRWNRHGKERPHRASEEVVEQSNSQDRRQGRQPWALHYVPDGRGSCAATAVRRHPGALRHCAPPA